MLTHIPSLYRRLFGDCRGIAMVEFAYSLPVVATLALGGLELTNLALAHLRVSQVAMTTADNAARVPTQVDESDINEIFSGALIAGRAIDIGTRGRIIISSLQENGQTGSNQGQTIRWQRCRGSLSVAPSYGRQGAGATNATLRNGMGTAPRRITAQPGTAVMFVEVTYDYESLLTTSLFGPIRIRYETALNVRERDQLGITNSGNIPVNSCP